MVTGESASIELAKAIDAKNIVVKIPKEYEGNEVHWINEILDVRFSRKPTSVAKVVINERDGTIIVDSKIEFKPVAIAHRNMIVDASAAARIQEFEPSDTGAPKLKSLVAALQALKVTPDGMIDIIRALDRKGFIYGKVIYK